jgi:hypothetical protein
MSRPLKTGKVIGRVRARNKKAQFNRDLADAKTAFEAHTIRNNYVFNQLAEFSRGKP